MKFFFYYPTWPKPSGGNKQLRLMASMLSEIGVESSLIRDREYLNDPAAFDDNAFYDVAVPVARFAFNEAGDHLGGDDVLILPEVLLDRTLPICASWRCRIAVNNQNGFFALRYRPPGRRFAGRIEFAIANAPYVAAINHRFLGVEPNRVFCVPYWVTHPPFELRDGTGERELAVCYMPRKLPEAMTQIREIVERRNPGVGWVEIDGVAVDRVAALYRQNCIFFSAQDLEGFGLPALEAMACGCLVVGFAGTGRFPHPYANPSNGIWVADRDFRAAAAALQAGIKLAHDRGDSYRRYLEAGRRTAERFGEGPALRALTDLARVVGERSYESRQAPTPRMGLRADLYAYRLLYDYERLGWPAQVAGRIYAATKPLRSALGRRQRSLDSKPTR